jgi:RNA polymerase sigma-70 factor (ECF subfamily)
MHREIHQRHLKNMAGQTEDVYTDNQLATLELQNRIYECIEGLPEQCKRIFRMNRIEGLKNEQIARQLNLSKRTVETQISKALKILRKKLADYFLWIILLKLFIT